MDIEIKYTTSFEKELKRLAKKHASIYNDLASIIKEIEKNPNTGSPLGNGLYKIRMSISSKGKGKSGGARVITYILINKEVVYLAAIYDKSEHSTVDTIILLKKLKAVFGF